MDHCEKVFLTELVKSGQNLATICELMLQEKFITDSDRDQLKVQLHRIRHLVHLVADPIP